eukprot:6390002-Heterocapsa_arctica.AAC.1
MPGTGSRRTTREPARNADGRTDTFPGDLRSTLEQGTFLILLLALPCIFGDTTTSSSRTEVAKGNGSTWDKFR